MKLTTFFSLLILFISAFTLNSQESLSSNWTQESLNTASFIENKGQFDGRNWRSNDKILYGYNQNPFYIFFTKKGVTYRFDKMIRTPEREKYDVTKPKRTNISELVFADWVGSNENVEIIAEDITSDYHSYAIKDPHSDAVSNVNNINAYKKITYKNIYDNIDIEYIIHASGGVKYNVILHPNADLSQVKLKYSSAKTSTSKEEIIDFKLNSEGQIEINTSLGTILEHAPITFYKNSKSSINSNYRFENNILSFNLEDYDHSKTVVIDPWIVSPTYTTSTAAWEVETDALGNVYSIGGETPMQLKKYSSAGVPQWTYTTPWDTSNVWLGTLATDNNGDSYVTSGVTANMHKVNNAGAMVWSTNLNGVQQLQWNSEWWSITFNCDKTRLIVGGTWADGIFPSGFYPGVYEISMATGAVISDQIVDNSPAGFTPIEVRSISSSVDGKYIFLTHNDVGAFDQNQALCGVEETIFLYDNQHHLGYKCENYLPATQNGGGLKALIANNTYFYTHTGNQIHRWNLTTGALINSVTLTGGTSTNTFGLVVQNSGLAVDNCGNVYAGSGDRVVKFNPDLTVNSSTLTSFRVYDVSVNANGEVIACGAQQNNSSTNRNGKIESLNMSACAQYSSTCCDATICVPAAACLADAPFTLVTATAGGIFSGTGVNPTTGLFSPSVAGVGTHTITYTLPCGSETITVVVNACSALVVCEEANGDFTVTGGNPVYTWQNWQTYSYASNDCAACGGFIFVGFCTVTLPCSLTATGWLTFGTGTTVTPPVGATSIQLTDGAGTVLLINPATVPACITNPCPTITLSTTSQTNVLCNGASTGAATVAASGGNGTYTYTWTPGNLNGPTRTSLAAGTYTISVVDGNGCPGTGTVTITQPAALSAPTTSVTAQPTCSVATGTITVTSPAPAAGVTYTVTGTSPVVAAQTNSTGIFSSLASGTYSVMATVNGCNSPLTNLTVNAQPAAPSAPTASVTAQPSCSVATGTITATVPAPAAGVTYTVTGTAPVVAAQTNATGIFSNLAPGNYTILTTVNGCVSGTTPLTVNAQPSAPAAPTASVTAQPSCSVATGTITATVPAPAAGVTYTLTGTAPVVAAQTNATGIFSNLAPGNYTILTTVNGCVSSTTPLTVNAQPAAPAAPTASVTSQPTCSTPTGIITVTVPAPAAGVTYTVTGTAPVVPAQTNSTGIFSGLAAGNYTVTTTVNGCTSTTTALTVNAAAGAPAAPTAAVTQTTCSTSTGSITVTLPVPAAGTTYTLTGISPVVAAQTNSTGVFNPLASGDYTVIVTISGCSSSPTPLTINAQPATPAAPTASVTQPSCSVASGTITITVPTPAAGTTYTVTGTAPVVAPQTNATGIFAGLASGDYSVTATVGGCTSAPTLVTINAQPTAPAAPTASITTAATCATPTGTITVTIPTPAAGTTYTVTGTSPIVAAQTNTTGVFSGLTVGTYDITTTVNGCTSTATVIIISPPAGAPTITLVNSTDVSCFNDSDGTAEVSGTGGTGTLTYAWSPSGGSSTSATGLTGGDYTVTVTDGTGCSSSLLVTIGEPDQIVITETVTDVICGSSLGQISTVASGGDGTYTYSWAPNGEITSNLSNLTAGNYSLTVTDGNGCFEVENYSIVIVGSLSIVATPLSTTITAGETVQLNATGATDYIWTPATGLSCTDCPDPIASPITTTTYTVTGSDANGCTGSAQLNIFVPIVCGDLYVPTVFSPNGEGPSANNVLCVMGSCISELNYAVYNRWGEKVFETTDKTICWNGLYKDKPVNSGVYAYKIYAVLFDGTEIEESGNLTIVR